MRYQQIDQPTRGRGQISRCFEMIFAPVGAQLGAGRALAGRELLGCPNRGKKNTLPCCTSKDVLHLAQRPFFPKKGKKVQTGTGKINDH